MKSVLRTDYTELTSCMNRHNIAFNSNTTGETSGAEIVCPSGALEIIPVFRGWGLVLLNLYFGVITLVHLSVYFEHCIVCPSVYGC